MFGLFLLTVAFAVLTQLMIPTTKAKAGTFEDFDFPTIEDGSPVYYIAGKVKVNSANLLWFGDFSSKAIKKQAGLFKKSIVGYKYSLGWQMGICLGTGGETGQVHLTKLWFGTDEPGWTGDMVAGSLHIKDDNAFGGDTGGGGYDLQCQFYDGSFTQIADPYLQTKIAGGDVPGWRGLSYIVMHGYIGNSTNLNTVSMEVFRMPDPLNLGQGVCLIGSEGDVNPACLLYEIMTNNFGALSFSGTQLNVQSFIDAAHTLKAEDEGISCAFGGSASAVSNAVQDILRQIDGTMFDDPVTGQVSLILIRQDYVISDLPVINPSNATEMNSYAINLWSDTKNTIRCTFTDRSRDYKSDAVAAAYDTSNIGFQGGIKPVTAQYPHIKRGAHASRAATRDLAVYSTPIANVRTTTRRFDMGLRPGSVVVLNYPEYRIQNLVLRVKKVDLGDLNTNRLLLDLCSDKFAKGAALFGAPASNPTTGPSLGVLSVAVAETIEAPRWFVLAQESVSDPDKPRVMALPKAPNSAQLGYELFAKVTGEASYASIDAQSAYPAYGTLYTAYPASYAFDNTTGLELLDVDDTDVLVSATDDQISTLGLNLILVDEEIMAFKTPTVNGSGRNVLKGVYRGLLDTVPAAHSAGAKVIWLTADNVGAREFNVGDAVSVVIGSKAPRGAQDATTGVVMSVPGEL